MTKAKDIADTIGRQRMADALGVGLTAISKAVVSGRFPASCYICIGELCRSASVPCSPELFGMKGIYDAEVRDAKTDHPIAALSSSTSEEAAE